jgi:putative redox protein
MSLTATARSVAGSLRQDILIDGKHRLTTDEPERLGGDSSAPAPHELFPAALAACVSTTLVMYARTKGWDLGQVVVDVDYDHRATPRTFEIGIHLSGELTDEQLQRLEKVAAACPLRSSIDAGIQFSERIERDSGPRPLPQTENICALQLTSGAREPCPGARCPLWSTEDGACVLAQVEYEIHGREDLARYLLELRHDLESLA